MRSGDAKGEREMHGRGKGRLAHEVRDDDKFDETL